MDTKKHISLENIGNELPFSVPENYFEDFAARIDKEIGLKPTSQHKIFRPWMYAAAAVFAGLLVLGPLFYNMNNKRVVAQNTENYESYVLSQVDESVMLESYASDESGK